VQVLDPEKLPVHTTIAGVQNTQVVNGKNYLAKYVVNADGTFETKQFKGWYLEPHGDTDNLVGLTQIEKLADLATATGSDYAGKTFDVYAAYGA
jgi:hypothetical protein